jgi:polyferredoxin
MHMQITTSLRSSARKWIGTAILTAGLAYPACAAICPKGIGGCPSPGRCFLFVDADGNSVCDYTKTAGTTSTLSSPPASGSSSVTTTHTTAAAVQDSSAGSVPATVNYAVPIFEIALFLLLTGIFSLAIRARVPGVQGKGRLPALALSAFFALGISLIVTCLLANTVSGTVFALVYMAAGSVLVGYLWYARVMTRKIVLAAALMSTLCGFVFVAPIMPQEIGGLVNVLSGVSAVTAGIIVICAVIGLALVIGRTFCGSICPVGSVQELAYALPVKKYLIRNRRLTEIVRLVVFAAAVIAALYLVDIMEFTGLYDLFSLTVSVLALVAVGLVALSVVVYRPVCRLLCPFGVLFSITAHFGRFRLHRTDACISCGKCERACPVSVAGKDDPKRECYLCGRCTEACPEDSALVYGR